MARHQGAFGSKGSAGGECMARRTCLQLTVDRRDITVRFQKRAHNPMLVAAGLTETATPLPWLAGRRLRLCLG